MFWVGNDVSGDVIGGNALVWSGALKGDVVVLCTMAADGNVGDVWAPGVVGLLDSPVPPLMFI